MILAKLRLVYALAVLPSLHELLAVLGRPVGVLKEAFAFITAQSGRQWIDNCEQHGRIVVSSTGDVLGGFTLIKQVRHPYGARLRDSRDV